MKKIARQVLPYVLFVLWVSVAAFTGMSIDQALADTTFGAVAGPVVAGVLLAIPALLVA